MRAAGAFRGAWRARLSTDWRFGIPDRWARIFDPGPLVVTLDPEGPGCRYFPVTPKKGVKWRGFTAYDRSATPPMPWVMSMMRSRNRLDIPKSIRLAMRLVPGAELHAIGQGQYLEVWPADEWRRFIDSVVGGLPTCPPAELLNFQLPAS